MMLKKLYLLEEELDRVKRFLDVEVIIAALAGLLASKDIITDNELTNAIKTVKRVSNYDFEIHEAEEDIEVFRLMMDTGAKERLRLNGLLNEDGTMKKETESEESQESENSGRSRKREPRHVAEWRREHGCPSSMF